jgi:glycosyltransferase involved in cell wall biosynthesis
MKIALVHDYLKEYGGAERVLETLHEICPKAPLFTMIYAPEYLGPHKKRFNKWNIKPSILQNIPFIEKLISPARLIAPCVFKNMDFSDYDVVIVSATGAYNPNLINKGKAIHICYCHTPPRYLYGYPTARNWKNNPILRVLGEIANHFLRMVDYKSAQNVDYYIANSKEVASRIEKFYRKKAKVIYPPVDIPKEQPKTKERMYYLAGGRLTRAKRVDLAVKVCSELNLPLKVFGKDFAGYGEELREMAGPTIEFLGEVTDKRKWKLMAGAKAYIFPAELEDFGITPVEAMAAGAPVIAFRSGGVMESVVDGKTGIFFNKANTDSLTKAIKKFEKSKIKPEDCIKQAKKFSTERFKKQIKMFINKYA